MAGLVAILLVTMNGSVRGTQMKNWQQFKLYITQKLIQPDSVVIESDRIVAELLPNTPGFEKYGDRGAYIWVAIAPTEYNFYREQFDKLGVGATERFGTSFVQSLILVALPALLLIAAIWFFMARSMRNAGAGPGPALIPELIPTC